jgi:excisionase family DNA binding protein
MFTVGQVCERLGVSRQKVYDLMNTGQLKSVKLGRHRRITENQLQEFITELEAAA